MPPDRVGSFVEYGEIDACEERVTAESEQAPPPVATEAEAMGYLYGVDAGKFVSARTALVKALRAAGDKDLATAVKALRKPSVIAAELNRSVRSGHDELQQLLDAADDLRSGHRAMLAGEPVDLGTLQRRHRAAAAAAAVHASRDRERIAAILEAASLDEACDSQLRSGTFTAEPTPASGFELLAGAAVAPKQTNVASLDRARRRKARAAAEKRSDDAEKAGQKGRKGPTQRTPPNAGGSKAPADRTGAAAPATAAVDPAAIERAENAVTLAKRRADAARRKRTNAVDRVAELERRLADARANLAETERAVEAAAAALGTAEEQLAEVSGDTTPN